MESMKSKIEEPKSLKDRERLGKKLAYILRYGAEREGLEVSEDGFVNVKQMMTTSIFKNNEISDIMEEVDQSVSMRGLPRFEKKYNLEGELVRATYGRRMQRSIFHAETKVIRLMEQAVIILAKNIDMYDLEDFPDNYILNLLMRHMKKTSNLSNKALRTFLVPSLTHLDLWNVYVNEGTLRLAGKNCPNLEVLILRDCSYVTTDHLLAQILKGMPKLKSLNLTGCHHVTDKGLQSIARHCPNLIHVNLTFLRNVTQSQLFRLLHACVFLEEFSMYNYKNWSKDGLKELRQLADRRKIRIETAGFVFPPEELGAIHDSRWERPNFR